MGDCRRRIGKVGKLIGVCPSDKDLDDSTYFHCLCQIGNIVPSPLIGASLTSIHTKTILLCYCLEKTKFQFYYFYFNEKIYAIQCDTNVVVI